MQDTQTELPRPSAVEGAGEILRLIRTGQAQTTSSIAAAMGVARSTVTQRLDYLAAQGLIGTETFSNGGRGRPAASSVFHPRCAVVLAAHVGLSGCQVAAADLAGTVLAHEFIDVDLASGADGLLADLLHSFDRLIDRAGMGLTQIAGIGVGVPRTIEFLSYLRSLGLSGTDWDRAHFHRVLLERYDVPVYLDTDVNLLALAEWSRSWPQAEVFVCAKLGTVIDAAVVVNGVPVRGTTQTAGELGHIKVSGPPLPCTCGGIGCLDAVASGSALARQLRQAGLDVHNVSQAIQLANDGEPQAVQAVRDAGRYIGEALSTVVTLLNPDAIAVWGYLAGAEPLLFSGIRESLYKEALPEASQPLTLVSATLGDLAGVLGAARLVIDEILAPAAVDQLLVAGSWTQARPSQQP